MTPLGSRGLPSNTALGRALPPHHCASLCAPGTTLLPVPQVQRGAGRPLAPRACKECHTWRAVPACPAFKWEQRERCLEGCNPQGSQWLPPLPPDNWVARKEGQAFLSPCLLSKRKRLGLAPDPTARTVATPISHRG